MCTFNFCFCSLPKKKKKNEKPQSEVILTKNKSMIQYFFIQPSFFFISIYYLLSNIHTMASNYCSILPTTKKVKKKRITNQSEQKYDVMLKKKGSDAMAHKK